MKSISSPHLFLYIVSTCLALFGPLAVVHAQGIPAPSISGIPKVINYQGRVAVDGVNFSGNGEFKFALVDEGQVIGANATATVALDGETVSAITITNAGGSYASAPTVTFEGNGTGAAAVAQIDEHGNVSSIEITNGGSGYTEPPFVNISAPQHTIYYTTLWSNDASSFTGEEPATSVPLTVNGGLYTVRLADDAAGMQPFYPWIFNRPLFLRVWFNDGVHGFQQMAPDQPLTASPYALNAEVAQSVATGVVGSDGLANFAVTSDKIANGSISPDKFIPNAITAQSLLAGAPPVAGQILSYDGEKFNWTNPGGGSGGFSLPVYEIDRSTSTLFYLKNQDSGDAIVGESFGTGVVGNTSGANSTGIYGYANGVNSSGLNGYSYQHHALYAQTDSSNRAAIWAYAPNGGQAIHAVSSGGDGVEGFSTGSGKSGIYGWTTNANTAGATFANTNNGFALKVFGKASIDGNLTVTRDVVANGDGNQQAYLGGNSDGDVEFGSKNAAVTTAAFYNPASNKFLNTIMRDASVRVLTIYGGADVAEPFDTGGKDFPKGSVVAIDPAIPGQLRLADSAYDTCVAGIVSGANGINPGLTLRQEGVHEGGQHVALTGRVYCRADASHGKIKPGDLLTTSDNPGHAMKVTDATRSQGAILGKAMSSLDEGTGYVLVLVTLQ